MCDLVMLTDDIVRQRTFSLLDISYTFSAVLTLIFTICLLVFWVKGRRWSLYNRFELLVLLYPSTKLTDLMVHIELICSKAEECGCVLLFCVLLWSQVDMHLLSVIRV